MGMNTNAYIMYLGASVDWTIRRLANAMQCVAGYTAELVLDNRKPDSATRKLLDVAQINTLDW
jgi:hypothetical protein